MVPQKRPEFVALRAQFRLLAIASFIIHYLSWQAERGLGHLPEMAM